MKKYFVVPYFGVFPNYFQLWLNSCSWNPDFNWVILNDGDIENFSVPSNVIVIEANLSEVRKILQRGLKGSIALNKAYKLCDFRPLYWKILDHYEIEYDYWGYCDVDLIFGNLSNFITDGNLINYNRMYACGHFSLMDASDMSKNICFMSGSVMTWQEVFFDDKSYGFDEHYGVNRIWYRQKMRFYDKESDIIDIYPFSSILEMVYSPNNRKKQVFFIEDGALYQGFWVKNTFIRKEYLYIHLQKRKLDIKYLNLINDSFFCFTNDKIISSKEFNEDLLMKASNKIEVSVGYFRRYARFYKKKIIRNYYKFLV